MFRRIPEVASKSAEGDQTFLNHAHGNELKLSPTERQPGVPRKASDIGSGIKRLHSRARLEPDVKKILRDPKILKELNHAETLIAKGNFSSFERYIKSYQALSPSRQRVMSQALTAMCAEINGMHKMIEASWPHAGLPGKPGSPERPPSFTLAVSFRTSPHLVKNGRNELERFIDPKPRSDFSDKTPAYPLVFHTVAAPTSKEIAGSKNWALPRYTGDPYVEPNGQYVQNIGAFELWSAAVSRFRTSIMSPNAHVK